MRGCPGGEPRLPGPRLLNTPEFTSAALSPPRQTTN